MNGYYQDLFKSEWKLKETVEQHHGDRAELLERFEIDLQQAEWTQEQVTVMLEIIHKAFSRGDIFEQGSVRENVVGIDYGFRYTRTEGNRERTKEKRFRLHTRKKLTKKELKEFEVATFGSEIQSLFAQSSEFETDEVDSEELEIVVEKADEVKTVVVKTVVVKNNKLKDDVVKTDVLEDYYGTCECQDSKADRCSYTMKPGFSVGHANNGAGTLGALVKVRSGGGEPKLGLLSCWHVLCGPQGHHGDLIYVPAPVDSEPLQIGNAEQATPRPVGRLQLNRMRRPDRDGDAAVAIFDIDLKETDGFGQVIPHELESGFKATDLCSDIMVNAFNGTAEVTIAHLGEEVIKSGRTTGVTRGRIDGVGIYMIDYPSVGLIPIDGFKIVPLEGNDEDLTSGGDSGSIWMLAKTGQAVGLHFEGEATGYHYLEKTVTDRQHEHALACHLERVLERLGAELVTEPIVPGAGD